jgi:hypothetical protein
MFASDSTTACLADHPVVGEDLPRIVCAARSGSQFAFVCPANVAVCGQYTSTILFARCGDHRSRSRSVRGCDACEAPSRLVRAEGLRPSIPAERAPYYQRQSIQKLCSPSGPGDLSFTAIAEGNPRLRAIRSGWMAKKSRSLSYLAAARADRSAGIGPEEAPHCRIGCWGCAPAGSQRGKILRRAWIVTENTSCSAHEREDARLRLGWLRQPHLPWHPDAEHSLYNRPSCHNDRSRTPPHTTRPRPILRPVGRRGTPPSLLS